MERPFRIALLHGFLGRPEDGAFLSEALERRGVPVVVTRPNLWTRAGATFDELVDEMAGLDADVLAGYSMGGRVAQCAFFRPTCRAQALIVLAAHPGGLDETEAEARRKWDRGWAERFAREPWLLLMRDWNALPVFSGDGKPPERREIHYPRPALAHALTHWSVAGQPDQRDHLRDTDRPVLWLAGANDAKYAAIAREMGALGEHVDARTIAGAGHRLLREAPEPVADSIADFLRARVPPETR